MPVLLLLILVTISFAQHPAENMSLVGRWARGHCRSVETFGINIAYTSGSTLFILDIDDQLNPFELGVIVLPQTILDLAVEGDYIYAIVRNMGFMIIDATDPENPTVVGETHPFEGELIKVVNGLAMVSFIERDELEQEGIVGFSLYNVSNPEDPSEVGRVELGVRGISRTIRDLDLDSQYAYIVEPLFGARIYSISDPEEPLEVSAIEGSFRTIIAQDTILFTNGDEGLRIYDIGDLENVELMNDWMPESSSHHMRLVGSLAYCTGSAGNNIGIKIINLSNLYSPRLLYQSERRDITYMPFYDLAVRERTVFAASSFDGNGLYAFDFRDFNNPILLFNRQDGGSLKKTQVRYDRIYAYGARSRLFSLDVSNPTIPEQNGPELFLDNSNEWRSTPAFLRYEDYFYLFGTHRFRIVDGSNPDELSEAGEIISVGGGTADAVIEGDMLYVLDRTEFALRIYDLVSPEVPQLVTSYRIPYRIILKKLYVQDDFAYIGSGELILILDVSDPERVQEVSQIRVPGNITQLLVEDDLLFASCGWWTGEINIGSLQIVDVTNINRPRVIGSYEPDNMFFRGLAKQDDMVYIAAERNGVRAIDVSNERDPVEVGYYSFYASHVIAVDSLVYGFGQNGEELFILHDDYEQSAVNERFIRLPTRAGFLTAYPNPFNTATVLNFDVSEPGIVRIEAYDPSGRRVALLHESYHVPGNRNILWNPSNLPSGNYILCKSHRGGSASIQMNLIR